MISLSPSLPLGDFEVTFYKLLVKETPNLLKNYREWEVGEVLNDQTCQEIQQKIAWWLFDSDPKEAILELEQLNNPSQLCGHVFKTGEATYTCRECAVDRTCVLCRKCFQQSEHKKHKYLLHSSGGGGCCDCGDVEAWNKFPSCNEHDVMSEHSAADAQAKLPTLLRNKAEVVFQILLDYIVDMLVTVRSEHDELPQSLQQEQPSDEFVTVVFNDESHTFDQVISTLVQAISCSPSVASDYATLIDREGRSAIMMGDNKSCEDCKAIVMDTAGVRSRRRVAFPLQTRVMHSSIYAHQEHALFLMSWLESLAQKSEGLRLILAQCILKKNISDGTSFVTKCMLTDASLWKGARGGYQQLILAVVMLHMESKRKFGVEFVRAYDRLVVDFLNDDHDHADSILSISVQVLTVPTLVRYLIVEEDLLLVLLKSIIKTFCNTLEEGGDDFDAVPVFQLDNRKVKKHFRRMLYVLYNIKYVLSNVPTDWDFNLHDKFKTFFKTFVAFLSAIEGMDAVVYKRDRHVEHEPEWETGITLLMRFIPIMKPLYVWCSIRKEVLVGCLQVAVGQLKKCLEAQRNPTTTVTYNGKDYTFTDFDILSKPVSVHVPLTRLTAGLLVQFGKLGLSLQDTETNMDVLKLAEHMFQSVCLCSQTTAGAWRRNGLSLANQVYYCRDNNCRAEAFDRDLQMLQLCAAQADPNEFFVLLHTRMKLNEPHKIAEYLTSIYNEFVSLLIYICVERCTEGVGQVTMHDIAKRELIHILASGPRPHSKISKHLPDEVSETPGWESILEEVADYKNATTATSVARYELKDSCLDQVSPCFYHFSTASHQTNAQNEVIRRKKSLNQTCIFTPNLSPQFTRLFTNVPDLLHSASLIHFIKDTLEKLLDESSSPLRWSDKLFEKILYLCGFAILEERERVVHDQTSQFQFCEKADKCGLLDCLSRLSSFPAASLHKDNIKWIHNGVDEVQKRRQGLECEDFRFLLFRDEESEKQKRKEQAAQRRQLLISQMSIQQKNFINVSPNLAQAAPSVEDTEMSQSSSQQTQETQGSSVDGPINPTPSTSQPPLQRETSKADLVDEPKLCILCQDDTENSDYLVIAAFVQRSNVLAQTKHTEEDLDFTKLPDLTLPAGVHVSSCSHVMHFQCWSQFFLTVRTKEESRPQRMRRFMSSFSTERNEYLCPMCRRLSNCVVPVISPAKLTSITSNSGPTTADVSLSDWLKTMDELVDPPEHVPQEIVAHLDVDMATPDDVNDEWHDASDAIPASQSSTVIMGTLDDENLDEETEEDSMRLIVNTMNKSFELNCEAGEIECEDPCLWLWLSAATTCQVVETVSRYRERPLMAPPSIRISQTLASTLRSSVVLAARHKGQFQKSREDMFKILLGKHSTPLLSKHMFVTFAHLSFACHALGDFPYGAAVNDKNLLKLFALAQIVQIILLTDVNQVMDEHYNDSVLSQLFNQVRSYANLPACHKVCHQKLEQMIIASLQPFIRACVLFTRYTTTKPIPVSLEQQDDFNTMLSYLELPQNIVEFFDASGSCSLDPLVQRWCSHPDVAQRCKEAITNNQLYPGLAQVKKLVELDTDYSDVIAKGANFVCPRFRSDDDSVNPTMCLICGEVLCSQSYCCQQTWNGRSVGACTYHAHKCNFGYGLFLRVRESTVVLLNDSRGTYRPAPYLDEYGETDQGLRRGNPLMLDPERLRDLHLVWFEHSIPEDIVWAMEGNRNWMNVNWDHL
uniref:E3 ubiquitin-protein ligase n=1 Tax=Phallusia mammillata TaxID=59560 RepID=A0A6F9DWG1_9ASCI|nr:E3 ubiquitin-protein ligase UBR2-like [Phallusia mammillata]